MNSDGTVTIWDVTSGAVRYTISPDVTPNWIALNADATRLATSTNNGQVSIWETQSQQQVSALSVATVNGLALSPDGTQLATLNREGYVQLWDLLPGREALTLVNNDSDEALASVGLAYGPDGQRLLATGTSTTPNVWDVQTGHKLLTLPGTGGVGCDWSADGALLATRREDHSAILWDASTGAIRYTLTGHADTIFAIAFSPDSSRLATSVLMAACASGM